VGAGIDADLNRKIETFSVSARSPELLQYCIDFPSIYLVLTTDLQTGAILRPELLEEITRLEQETGWTFFADGSLIERIAERAPPDPKEEGGPLRGDGKRVRKTGVRLLIAGPMTALPASSSYPGENPP
jgi:hypothetical protein